MVGPHQSLRSNAHWFGKITIGTLVSLEPSIWCYTTFIYRRKCTKLTLEKLTWNLCWLASTVIFLINPWFSLISVLLQEFHTFLYCKMSVFLLPKMYTDKCIGGSAKVEFKSHGCQRATAVPLTRLCYHNSVIIAFDKVNVQAKHQNTELCVLFYFCK